MPTSRRPVVLLVQPSRDDGLDMYTEFLRYHGLAVIPVSDSTAALMLTRQADIVVTGVTLDDPMDGVELVSRLRHDDRTRSTPIIVLTACALPTDRGRAEGAGCDVFLLKPCLPNDLLVRRVTGYQDFVDEAPLDLVYVVDHTRMRMVPAGQRGSYSSAAVGAICQNVYLYAAANGLAT